MTPTNYSVSYIVKNPTHKSESSNGDLRYYNVGLLIILVAEVDRALTRIVVFPACHRYYTVGLYIFYVVFCSILGSVSISFRLHSVRQRRVCRLQDWRAMRNFASRNQMHGGAPETGEQAHWVSALHTQVA